MHHLVHPASLSLITCVIDFLRGEPLTCLHNRELSRQADADTTNMLAVSALKCAYTPRHSHTLLHHCSVLAGCRVSGCGGGGEVSELASEPRLALPCARGGVKAWPAQPSFPYRKAHLDGAPWAREGLRPGSCWDGNVDEHCVLPGQLAFSPRHTQTSPAPSTMNQGKNRF